jgi:hypothetical protein
MIISEEKKELFDTIKVLLGAPVRKVELDDIQLNTLFTVCVSDYVSEIQNWLTESKWMNLHAKNITTLDLTHALTTFSLDYETQFSYAYSKQVGLQQRGPFELKKDYFLLETGKQVYQIPAKREINRILWLTPPSLHSALMANYGGFDTGFGGGMAQVGGANVYGNGGIGGLGGYYISPAVDVLATAMDMSLKSRLLRSDMTYKVTAGPNGTRLVHLSNVPGKTNFSNNLAFSGQFPVNGYAVWYYYYDTENGDVDECMRYNPDIITSPDQVPFDKMDYYHFNPTTKTLIRKLLLAESKILLAMIRGKFSGVLSIKDAEMTMDYKMFEVQGLKEKEDTIKELRERLSKLTEDAMLKKAADRSENLKNALKNRPLGWFMA